MHRSVCRAITSEHGTVISKTAKLWFRPGNDDLANAIPLAALGGWTIGDNRDASKETGEPDHADDAGGSSDWTPVSTNMVLDAGLSGWEVPVTPAVQRQFFRALRR